MRTYQVTITGKTPLLMHHDNIDWADFMDEWKANPENKKFSKAGNIMRCVMEGGAMAMTAHQRGGGSAAVVRPQNDLQRGVQEHQGRLLHATKKDLKKARMNVLPSTATPEQPRIAPPKAS